MSYLERETFFFIGIAGSGMSALAQFMAFMGKKVLGSDRLFVLEPQHPIKLLLKNLNIELFPQGEAFIPNDATVVVSTAIEDNVPELIKAKNSGLDIIHRTDLLEAITEHYKTIAVAGTSGKSTTTAMIFHILQQAGLEPSIITGAPLLELVSQKIIGNAWLGKGEWLVIEADESDASLTKYRPYIGVILNISLDHKNLDELKNIFSVFANNAQKLVFNANDSFLKKLSNKFISFCFAKKCDFVLDNIKLSWGGTEFKVNGHNISITLLGKHNAINSVAAISASVMAGVNLDIACKSLESFKGIERRMQVIYRGVNYSVIDDYAHNPSKIKAAIETAQTLASQVIAWFQPHGFSPLRLWGNELIDVLAQTLRKNDIFVMSPVYYVGGNVSKDICVNDYVIALKKRGVNSVFLQNRKSLPSLVKENSLPHTVVLLMGARDPLLSYFAQFVANQIIYFDN